MPDGGKLVIDTENVTLDEAYCRLHLGVKACDYAMLSVSDSGQGMEKETLQHIFEPFYTTKETGQGNRPGTGHGVRDRRTTRRSHHLFQRTRRRDHVQNLFSGHPSQPFAEKPTKGQDQLGGAETILLVDDEEFIRDLGKRILERSGYRVLTAVNGKDALDRYKKEGDKISLVIMDLIMPEMGGYQCLEELLKIAPNMKVIIASGHYGEGTARETVETQAKGFVRKPYDIKQVLWTVREALDKS